MKDLDEKDKSILRYLQDGLPIESTPYKSIADQVGLTEQELFRRISLLKEKGIIRRLKTILNHYLIGYTANVMVVWEVPAHQIKEAVKIMTAFPVVSHCYQRATLPNWSYNIFTMIHGRSREECEKVIKAIADRTNLVKYESLYTLKEYKKSVRHEIP